MQLRCGIGSQGTKLETMKPIPVLATVAWRKPSYDEECTDEVPKKTKFPARLEEPFQHAKAILSSERQEKVAIKDSF